MYVKYASGTVVELTKAKYTKTLVHRVDVQHVLPSDISLVRRLGLEWQEWIVKGAVTLPESVSWRDVVQVSLDNTSWRNCVTASVDFSRILIDQTLYELRLYVSPSLIGAAVRYPTSNYKWGAQSVSMSQNGTALASPVIYIYPPDVMYPFARDLLSYEGSGITFTRTAAKVHGGISYGINVPAFDDGIYLGSDTSSDVAKVTLPTATVRTVGCQIKLTRYPSPWVIGAGAGTPNLLTANQSNVETDTTGFAGSGGTMTRDTSAPLVGTGSLKMVATGGTNAAINTGGTKATVTAGRWYCGQVLMRTSGCAAGRKVNVNIVWYQSDGSTYISEEGLVSSVDAPTTATVLSFVVKAPALAGKAMIQAWIVSAATSETMYCDSFMIEELPTVVTIWTSAHNALTIDIVNNLLKWYDGTTTVSATFPTASFMTGVIVDAIVIDGTSHAVTVIAHAASGTWYTNTGTLALVTWPELTLGVLEGSIAWLTQWAYALTSSEYQDIVYSLAPWQYNNLYISVKAAGNTILGTDGSLLVGGTDMTWLVGGVLPTFGSTAANLAESGGISCRWYAELSKADIS